MGIICILYPKRYRSPFTNQSQYNFARGRVPQIGGGIELEGRVWYPAKVLRIRYNFLAGTETLSLFVYEPIAMQILLGDRPPIWVGVELGGRVWHPVKVFLIRNNLFAGTETLSLSVYEPIAMQFFAWGDRPPIWVGG